MAEYVTIKGKVWKIFGPNDPQPTPIGRGRKRSKNNDDELVERALRGLQENTYVTFKHAAECLCLDALSCIEGKEKRCGSDNTIIERLSRKISKAYKDRKHD